MHLISICKTTKRQNIICRSPSSWASWETVDLEKGRYYDKISNFNVKIGNSIIMTGLELESLKV